MKYMQLDFRKDKYGTQLTIDCFIASENNRLFLRQTPFFVTFYEMIFFTKGKGIFRINDEIIPFERGSVLLLPPNKWRQWVQVEGEIDAYFLIFEDDFISHFFNDALYLYRLHFFYNSAKVPSYIKIEEDNYREVLFKLKEIRTEIHSLKTDSEHLLRALLYYLLIQLNRMYESTWQLDKEYFQENIILEFKKLLEKHIRTHQKVSEYADLLGISKSYLNKKLQTHLGKSCSELIKERLLAEIKKELLFSNKSISEIAFSLNFSEPANFNRFFQKGMKMPPKHFRQQYSK